MSNTNSNYIYIYNNINNIINNNNLISISSEELKEYIETIENPNDLDLAFEINQVDKYLQKNPKKAFWWKEDWQNRLQAWIIRTQRPNRPRYTPPPLKQLKTEDLSQPEPLEEVDPTLSTETIKLLQEWLNKYPMLYKLYPSIYKKIPFPEEWLSPNHWGFYFRHYRQGYDHLNQGDLPKEIINRYKLQLPQQIK
jgi:hypothetical protein